MPAFRCLLITPQRYYIFLNCTSFFTFYLLRTAQDTVFFVLVVDAFAGVAALCTEIEVAMKVENEHLAEIIVPLVG